jgi:hypothetical protein
MNKRNKLFLASFVVFVVFGFSALQWCRFDLVNPHSHKKPAKNFENELSRNYAEMKIGALYSFILPSNGAEMLLYLPPYTSEDVLEKLLGDPQLVHKVAPFSDIDKLPRLVWIRGDEILSANVLYLKIGLSAKATLWVAEPDFKISFSKVVMTGNSFADLHFVVASHRTVNADFPLKSTGNADEQEWNSGDTILKTAEDGDESRNDERPKK